MKPDPNTRLISSINFCCDNFGLDGWNVPRKRTHLNQQFINDEFQLNSNMKVAQLNKHVKT